MPLDASPPELPPWDPAAAPEAGDLLEDPAAHQWVLVRYVGQPMGEAIPLPAQGLEGLAQAEGGTGRPGRGGHDAAPGEEGG